MINWEYLAGLDFSVLWTYRLVLLKGFATTLWITALASLAGLVLGTVLAALSQARLRPVRWLVAAYVEIWRDTPLLVQLVWFHFALPALTGVPTSVYESGLITLTLNVTAYFTEIVRAGIEAVDRGQREAALALALPGHVRWRRIILPQAIRIMLPPLTSLVISLFKATAILSVLTINELMRVTTQLSNYSFKPVELLTAVAFVYILTGWLMSRAAGRIERRLRLPGA